MMKGSGVMFKSTWLQAQRNALLGFTGLSTSAGTNPAIQGSVTLLFTPTGVIRGNAPIVGTSTALLFATTSVIRGQAPVVGTAALGFTTTGVISDVGEEEGFDWPGAHNTGHSGTLTDYSGPMTISTNNQTIENKRFHNIGRLVVGNEGTGVISNTTIRNCLFEYTAGSEDDYHIEAEWSSGLLVEDCTFIGPGLAGSTSSAILGNLTIRRCDISGVCLGLNLQGTSTIENNWLHDFGFDQPDLDPHYDGLALQGGNVDTVIQHNLIEMPDRGTAIIFVSAQFEAIDGVLINHNKLLHSLDGLGGGPAFTVHVEEHSNGTANVVITNNVCEAGDFGYFANDAADTIISGNVDHITGADVDAL